MTSIQRLRGVLAALNPDPDFPLDEDLVRLVRCAADSERLQLFIERVRQEPATLHAMWDVGPDELIEELRSTRIPWTKIARLVPQLTAAIAALESET